MQECYTNEPEHICASIVPIFKTLNYTELQKICTFADVVKTTVFIKDMNDLAVMNTMYAEYFTKDCPARACIEVARLPKDALVEIEVISICKL